MLPSLRYLMRTLGGEVRVVQDNSGLSTRTSTVALELPLKAPDIPLFPGLALADATAVRELQ
jgi:hypothetical protein